jgi:hypothetical protein
MAGSSTARVHLFRQRQRAGKRLLTIAPDDTRLQALLASHGLIPSCGSEDSAVLAQATDRLLERLMDANELQG